MTTLREIIFQLSLQGTLLSPVPSTGRFHRIQACSTCCQWVRKDKKPEPVFFYVDCSPEDPPSMTTIHMIG